MRRPAVRCGDCAALVLAALLALGGCGGEREKEEPSTARRPGGKGFNVLLISLDSARRDIFGCYGYRPRFAPQLSPSPNIDSLARSGVRMVQAHSSTSWTLPSHMAMMSGQPDLVHGVELDTLEASADHPMLAEILRAHGYRTAGFFSGPYLDGRYGFSRGFQRYEACYGPGLAAASQRDAVLHKLLEDALDRGERTAIERLGRQCDDSRRRVGRLAQRDRSAPVVTAAALAELERAAAGEKPWFLFAHYFDPHYDYVPPSPFAERFDPAYEGEINGEGFYHNAKISVPDPADPRGRLRRVSDRDLDHVRALYDGELAWTDEYVGRLLERLDELGQRERTLVILTADHGDEFFEHGGIGHRRTLYEEVLRVPLILRLPGVLPSGKAVPGLVSLADLMPTVLEILDLPVPASLATSSFLPLVREGGGGERQIFSRLVFAAPLKLVGTALATHQIFVEEKFRRGTIEILRRRDWVEVPAGVPPAQRGRLEAERDAMRAREFLGWCDLTRQPAERDLCEDFSDPRAARLLEEFRARYERLRRLRRPAERAPQLGRGVNILAGLGYAGGGGEQPPPPPTARLVLPLPGD